MEYKHELRLRKFECKFVQLLLLWEDPYKSKYYRYSECSECYSLHRKVSQDRTITAFKRKKSQPEIRHNLD